MKMTGLTDENERISRTGDHAADMDQREDGGDDRPQFPSNTDRDEEAGDGEHSVQDRGCADEAAREDEAAASLP